MSRPTIVRILLVDDHPVVLAGVKALVLADSNLEVVGEAVDGAAALRLAKVLEPDIVVLDISLPDMNGVQVARRLREECPKSKILILTVHEDRGYLRQLLEIGISGYLLKRSATNELGRAITSVAAGGLYLDPAVAGMAIEASAPHRPESEVGTAELSTREIEVMKLAASGHSNKSAAAILGIGVKSVESYKARAMDKLGFRSRVELVRFALNMGWLAS